MDRLKDIVRFVVACQGDKRPRGNEERTTRLEQTRVVQNEFEFVQNMSERSLMSYWTLSEMRFRNFKLRVFRLVVTRIWTGD